MRQHTVAGERILGATREHAPGRAARARLARALGRRRLSRTGCAGEAIPLEARIVCACDAYDAMLSRRALQGADDARARRIAELRRCAGTQFDPRVVEVAREVATQP